VALVWVVSVVALFAAWQPLWQPFLALPGITALFLVWWPPPEAESQSRLAPERGRLAAGRHNG